MMIYETQFLHQYRQTDSAAQLGRAWGKADSRERLRLPSPTAPPPCRADWDQGSGKQLQGWDWACRLIRKMIKKLTKNNNAGIQMPWCRCGFSLFAFWIWLWNSLFSCGAKEGVSVSRESQVDTARAPVDGLRGRVASSVSEAVLSLYLELKGQRVLNIFPVQFIGTTGLHRDTGSKS